MAQHDYIISNQGFPATRADINNVLNSIATLNSGTSAPATQYAGQMWIDTTTATAWILYIYDGTDNIQLATINTSTNTVNFTDSALDVLTDTTPQLGGDLDANGSDIQFDDNTGIRDDSDNEQLTFQKTASAVNELTITNSATGNAPELSATGDDTDIDLKLTPKGAGKLNLDGIKFPNADGVNNQILKTDGAGALSFINPPTGFRNIVINGDMSIAQRSTSVASITTSDYYTLDRFRTAISSLGTWTQSQSTDTPTGQGFASSVKMDCTTADASPAASDFFFFQQRVEGQNLQYLKKGTANAVPLTLSFWVKSTKTGTFIAELQDVDNTRSISKSYTVSVTNTWEKKTITFEGDTTGAFGNDNGDSLYLNFFLGVGSDRSSGTLATSWESTTQANRAVGQVNCADSTSNDWYITGVQLEAGTNATDFEFLPVDVNLGRCLRYFEKLYNLTTAPADGATNYTSGGAAGEASWTCFTTNNIRTGTTFKVQKRASPTVTLFRGSSTATAATPAYYNDSDAWAAVTSPSVAVQDSVGFNISSASTSTRGRSYLFEGGWTASAEL